MESLGIENSAELIHFAIKHGLVPKSPSIGPVNFRAALRRAAAYRGRRMDQKSNCVLLADRHHGLRDSVRGLLERIRARASNAKVLLLSVHDERTVAEAAIASGADAVVLKRCLATDLLLAVDAVRAGGHYISPGLSR